MATIFVYKLFFVVFLWHVVTGVTLRGDANELKTTENFYLEGGEKAVKILLFNATNLKSEIDEVKTIQELTTAAITKLDVSIQGVFNQCSSIQKQKVPTIDTHTFTSQIKEELKPLFEQASKEDLLESVGDSANEARDRCKDSEEKVDKIQVLVEKNLNNQENLLLSSEEARTIIQEALEKVLGEIARAENRLEVKLYKMQKTILETAGVECQKLATKVEETTKQNGCCDPTTPLTVNPITPQFTGKDPKDVCRDRLNESKGTKAKGLMRKVLIKEKSCQEVVANGGCRSLLKAWKCCRSCAESGNAPENDLHIKLHTLPWSIKWIH